jgi:hypothetical protein
MALSFRQNWQLRGIERRLRKSEPKLAAMFEDFAELKVGPAASDSAEACCPGSWTRRQFSRIANGWLVATAASEGWLDPRRSVGM